LNPPVGQDPLYLADYICEGTGLERDSFAGDEGAGHEHIAGHFTSRLKGGN
jgi:hypothetical protein